MKGPLTFAWRNVVFARDVEAFGVVPPLAPITVGRCENAHHERARLDRLAADLDVVQGDAAGHLHRRVVAQ